MTAPAESPSMATEARPRDWTSWIMILGFCLCIAMPGLVQLSGLDKAANENRTLAPPPVWPTQLSDVLDLPRQTEAYINDRFGLRSQLVLLNSLVRYAIDVSTTSTVAFGRHKFLFYAYEPERLMEQHTGEDSFSPEELDRWLNSIATDKAWLAARGIAFYVIIAPDKSTIFPEYLPDYPRLPDSTTRLDQVVDAVAKGYDIDLIDPRAAIKAGKTTQMMYTRDDTHWAVRGAFVGYSLLVKRIQERFPNVHPVTLDDFDITPMKLRGDLTNQMNLYGVIENPDEYAVFKGKSHLLATDKFDGRPPWGWPYKKMHTDLQRSPKLLVQGDSFTDYVMGPHFLYETFKDPVYTHHNGTTLNKSLIEETHPDIVVLELAERYLNIP